MAVKIGQIIQLGRHSIMCGDAGNPEHVDALFEGAVPDLVFTSPPYAQQRDYTKKIDDWEGMMRSVFGAMPHHERTQVLVNLGLVHRDGEWQPYWDGWIEWMRTQGWRRFGWYVWDKQESLPGDFNGRPAPGFEFIFHFNQVARRPNKTVPCKWHGKAKIHGTSVMGRDSVRERRYQNHEGVGVNPFKIPGDVFRVTRDKANRTGHPAVFPVALPAEIMKVYTDPGEIVYEPFAGSGTSIIAAEQEGRRCYAMEIAPEYVEIILKRWQCRQPVQTSLFNTVAPLG